METTDILKKTLTPEKCVAVYHLKHADAKGTILTGKDGASHFLPNPTFVRGRACTSSP